MTQYKRFVGIDWSGARGPRLRGLKVAECLPGRGVPTLVNPAGRRWRRDEVADWLVQEAAQTRLLIGLDFAFAYPYCDQAAYFPGHGGSPADVQTLWQTVNVVCANAVALYGGPFYLNPAAPFADFLCYQTYTGPHFDNTRLRITEQACQGMGERPSCVFKCVGPDAVGAGSIAGMRLLHLLNNHRDSPFSIWPFAEVADAKSTVVEIFPRLFFLIAGQNPRQWQSPVVLNATLGFYQSDPLPPNQFPATEDEADAIVSAAALRHLSSSADVWTPRGMTQCAKSFEGWIFGAQ